MDFKTFKKLIIAYFSKNSVVKRRYIKKSLHFKDYSCSVVDYFSCHFTFNEQKHYLEYFIDEWELDGHKNKNLLTLLDKWLKI